MPSNKIVVNGQIEYVIPDSRMDGVVKMLESHATGASNPPMETAEKVQEGVINSAKECLSRSHEIVTFIGLGEFGGGDNKDMEDASKLSMLKGILDETEGYLTDIEREITKWLV